MSPVKLRPFCPRGGGGGGGESNEYVKYVISGEAVRYEKSSHIGGDHAHPYIKTVSVMALLSHVI